MNKMAKKTEPKKPELEREYVIPLREKCRPVPRYKKTNKAVKTVKEFLAKHMKIYDRDLRKIKVDMYLNEYLWFRGIRSPPHKVKVKAIKEGDIVRVELADMPEKLKFKKAREEKREEKATQAISKKKPAEEKKPEEKTEEEKKEEKPEERTEEEKEDEKEKAKAGSEAGEKRQKQEAKKVKHTTGGKTKQPKRPVRVAMNK